MNDERQQFEKPTKPSPAGPVTHRAVMRRRGWRRLGSLFGRVGNYSATDPRAWDKRDNPQPTTDDPQH